MVTADLIPLKKGDPRTIELCRKGGLVRSANKSLAARLRNLRQKGLTDESSKLLYDMMTDPAISALDIQMFLQTLKKDVKYDKDKIALSTSMIQLRKVIHGEKHINTNININVSAEEFDRRLFGDD